jgi:hypothetical protein
MPVNVAVNPLHSVVIGSGHALEEVEALGGVLYRSSQPEH